MKVNLTAYKERIMVALFAFAAIASVAIIAANYHQTRVDKAYQEGYQEGYTYGVKVAEEEADAERAAIMNYHHGVQEKLRQEIDDMQPEFVFMRNYTAIVTFAGNRYHQYGCRHIRNREFTIYNVLLAEFHGYTPCLDCWDKGLRGQRVTAGLYTEVTPSRFNQPSRFSSGSLSRFIN